MVPHHTRSLLQTCGSNQERRGEKRSGEMTGGAMAAGSGGLFKFLRPGRRPGSTEITSAALWGVAAGTTALWVIQPFDWIKKQLSEKPEPDQ